jgi:hypothetical protein
MTDGDFLWWQNEPDNNSHFGLEFANVVESSDETIRHYREAY